MYRELDLQQIVTTAERLSNRIAERFPDSGLWRVSRELVGMGTATRLRIDSLRRPHWPIRSAVGIALLAILGVVVAAIASIQVRAAAPAPSELLQGMEAAISDAVFIGIAVFFLMTVEGRLKRRAALKALHELRSLAHIIDMHQLTKDPEHVISPPQSTASSPKRSLTRFELARYLDYCSECLSITSKLATLYVQFLHDPVVLSAVNDIQALTQGLSSKIWQKIIILDTISPREAPAEP